VLDESCPNCYGTNIKFGGRFKVNKAKKTTDRGAGE